MAEPEAKKKHANVNRNFKDCVTLEELDIEIHLPKEGQVISKDAKSQAKLVHGIQVVIARNYIENLREEVKKGMREKAEQGIYPGRPPFGYRNNVLERTIEVDAQKAAIARRMFELYGSGQHSLRSLGKVLRGEFRQSFPKAYLQRLLRNPFYLGQFVWQDKLYAGTHEPLIPSSLFEQVQSVFLGRNKPKFRKHEFAFRGLLTCAYDHCSVTAEIKKNKYTYYHCTGHRGKCDLPYFREEELSDKLGGILKDIHIPDNVLAQLQKSLLTDKGRQEQLQRQQRERLDQRLRSVRSRLDQAYLDKLDGKISETFWERKAAEWHAEEQQIQQAIQELGQAKPARILDSLKILELANRAYSLYLKQTPAEKAKLLRIVLSNCSLDAVSAYPTYRKPFDLIFQRAKTQEWCPREDSNLQGREATRT
jgi:site-specific DNA recombinase